MQATNPSEALAVCMIDELARCGVTDACLAPGSRSAPLALALANEQRIRLHVTLDERSASFLALGIAKSSQRPVVVLSTSGTAAVNFHPAVVEAHHSRVPLIVMTADRPPELRGTGANQTIDQIKLFGDAVRWFCEVGAPEDLQALVPYWRSTAARAAAVSQGSPPGPVHLNIAFREPLTPSAKPSLRSGIDGRPDGAPWLTYTPARKTLSDEDAAEIASELQDAKGVVVAGAGVREPGAVVRLAESLGWPLLADPLSGARQGPNAIASYDALLRTKSFAKKNLPKIALRFGALGISKVLAEWLTKVPRHILVDADGWWLDPNRSIDRLVVADESDFCKTIGTRVGAEPGAWLKRWTEADAGARAAIGEILAEEPQLTEPAVAKELVAALPKGSDLVVASSMPFRDIEWFTAARDDVRFFGNRGANGIDGFVSTALGVALGGGRPTFALCGDLSLLHDQNGLLLQNRSKLQLTLIVVNNDGGGIFSFLPQAELPENFERLFGTPHGLDLRKFAELHDCHYEPAKSRGELLWALEHRGGVRIIEVKTNRSENVAVHQRLNEAVATRLGR